jgi:hypothetical protein
LTHGNPSASCPVCGRWSKLTKKNRIRRHTRIGTKVKPTPQKRKATKRWVIETDSDVSTEDLKWILIDSYGYQFEVQEIPAVEVKASEAALKRLEAEAE